MTPQAKLKKYDGTTGEIISTRNTILTRAEIIESLKCFWPYVVLEFDEDATMADVYNKKGDEYPAFTFEICDL